MQPPTYPGVYIQELPSGNRTLVGVSTSITAFVGRARRGPVDEPTRVTSFAEFERTFGALWNLAPLGYAVRHYFLSGGTEALIVRVQSSSSAPATASATAAITASDDGVSFLRLEDTREDTEYALKVDVTHGASNSFTLDVYEPSSTGTYGSATETYTVANIEDLEAALVTSALVRIGGTLPIRRPDEPATAPAPMTAVGASTPGISLPATFSTDGSVPFEAASPGVWANRLYISISHSTSTEDSTLFNLTIEELDADGAVVADEVFRNVSLDEEHARYIGTVLEESSSLLALSDTSAVSPPGGGTYAGGSFRPSEVTRRKLSGGTDGGAVSSTDVKTSMQVLAEADLFNLLCLPPPTFSTEIETTHWAEALAFCELHRAICIVDAPTSWTTANAAAHATSGLPGLNLASANGAMYFPWLHLADPLRENRLGTFAPCGVVAGLIAKTDAQRGIWKAPAGLDARTPIVRGLEVNLTDDDQGILNPIGLNCLRTFSGVGTVVWGGRTLEGNDKFASDWKYLPVRRLALHIEESLYRGLQWAVFEPNDEPLWSQIRASVGGFMQQLFRQGAFKGAAAKDAYFVKCDAETTTDADIDRGIVNIHVGFAPLKPAEFVILSIQQIAGQAGG